MTNVLEFRDHSCVDGDLLPTDEWRDCAACERQRRARHDAQHELFAATLKALDDAGQAGVGWSLAHNSKIRALAEAADKPLKRLIQFDGFRDVQGDSVMHPDADGDTVFGYMETHELNKSIDETMPVRVFVHPGARTEDVLRLLSKISAWIERDSKGGTVDALTDGPEDLPF